MKFSDTITVYTVIPQQGRTPERLQKTIVKGVFWDRTFGAEYSKKGENERDSVTVMIPDSPDVPAIKAGDIYCAESTAKPPAPPKPAGLPRSILL